MNRYAINRMVVPLLTVLAVMTLSSLPVFGAEAQEKETAEGSALYSIRMPFIENADKASKEAPTFYAPTFEGGVAVTDDGAITYFVQNGDTIKERLVGGTPHPHGEVPSPAAISAFSGNKKERKTKLPSYDEISLGTVYEGIELQLKAYGKRVEKVFTVRPGGKPDAITMSLSGASALHISPDGSLEMTAGPQVLRFSPPEAYQVVDGARKDVVVTYVVRGNTYGFIVGEYDQGRELIIDPVFTAKILGGHGTDTIRAMRTDDTGAVYVAGSTRSSNFISATIYHGGLDAFVAKFDPALQTLVAFTYLGGAGDEEITAMAVANDRVTVTGHTRSSDFPTTFGAFDTTYNGGADAFIATLDLSLETLDASTFFGGGGDDKAAGLVVSPAGTVYIAGVTGSLTLPEGSGGFDSHHGGGTEAFVASLDASLKNLQATTFLGGTDNDAATALAYSPDDTIVVSGITASTDFPATAQAFDKGANGGTDTFVTKFDLRLKRLLAATFLGGSGNDEAAAVAVDSTGAVYMAGTTRSPDFPAGLEAASNASAAGANGFVTKFTPSLDAMVGGIIIGGAGDDAATALALDPAGIVFIAGTTRSSDFPVSSNANSTGLKGSSDIFVASLDGALTRLAAATFVGGSADEEAHALTVDADGMIYLGGTTTSPDFAGATETAGYTDTFVVKMDGMLGAQDAPTPPATEGTAMPATTGGESSPAPEVAVPADRSTGTSAGAEKASKDKLHNPTVTDMTSVAGPGWLYGTAPAVSPADAKAYHDAKQKALMADPTLGISSLVTAFAATDVSPEITELARALRNDPKLIYDYVHNYIDYVPYYGSHKGATLTYLDGSGNDFDQASLMISLLRAAGYTAQYQLGQMTIPGDKLANLLGTDQKWQAIGNVISSGGIPTTSVTTDGTTTFTRVWVKANIGGTDYLFDPAFKTYDYKSKIDIGASMGYNAADFLSGATTGATIAADYVQNINETNIKTKLAAYTGNLVAAIRTQYPNHDVKEIISGRSIVQSNLAAYSATLPFSPTVTATWDVIPASYTATLRIQHVGINYTFSMHDLSGKRLTLTYVGADNHPELKLDGVTFASGTATTRGTSYDCIVAIDHPYPANGGTYIDQTVTYKPISGSTYAIVYNFGGVSDLLQQKRQQTLDTYKAQGLADSTESVLGETLNIMGMTWLKEVAMSNRILSAVAETVAISHHNIGFMCQETGYYIDVKAGYGSMISKHKLDQATRHPDETAHFKAFSLIGSALEHGILEQLMGSDKPGVSTMKLFQIANSTGRKIYSATSTNFATVKPLLVNYSAADLTDFQNQVNASRTLILPDNGQLVLNSWKGKGYLNLFFSGSSMSMGMIIGGGYFGGYGSVATPVYTPTVTYNTTPSFYSTYTPTTISLQTSTSYMPATPTSRDPVDLAGGAFLVDSTDLALGGATPFGLAFTRSYDSNYNYTKKTLGYGWNHNYDIYVAPISDPNPVLGGRQPVDMASFTAAAYVILDVLKGQQNVQGWVTASLATKWAIDQTIDNAVAIRSGKKLQEFVKLPDTTYAAPPGSTAKLLKNGDGTYSVTERFGTKINFNLNKKASQVVDIDGNTLAFTYTGADLTTVRDAFSRTLTLAYASGRISSVTDSTGRKISFTYDVNNNLTGYTDPELKVWGYGYDANHRMTTLSNPVGTTTATNVYDGLGRVKTQTVPRQGATTATYNFYFSGYRNVEQDPLGNPMTYFFDEKGRTVAVVNALGQRSTNSYDGQNHLVSVTYPQLNTMTYTYDGNHNVIKVTNALGKSVSNIYDAQFRLTDTSDPLSHTTHFDYDTEHHLLAARNPLGNQTSATYYASGLKNTATDARTIQSILTYDSYGNPATVTTASHPAVTYTYDVIGRMTSLTDQVSAKTSFAYDKRGLLLSKTDPLLKVTSFSYDNAGRLTTKTDRNSSSITYAYTPSDKLEKITYPNLSTVTFAYNAHDQLTSMTDLIGTTTYAYDGAGRLATQTSPYGLAVSYTYDSAGNMTTLTYPGGKKVTYGYDALNRLVTVTNWLSQTANYTYDDAGRLTTMTNFNGITTTYGYDAANRLTSSSSPVATYSFTLDGNGNRTSVSQTEPFLPPHTAATTAYAYNTPKNRLLTAGANSFAYDSEGQLSSGYGSSYSFDYEHRLSGFTGASYSYDAYGNRLQATRSGTTSRYVYDATGHLLAETDATNTITRYYIHGQGLLALATPSDQIYCYHYNAVGSAVAVSDQSRTVVNKYAYDAFGALAKQQESVPQPFKYVGQFGVMTEPNGFYYMRARYYDPSVGRFISEDPIGFAGGDVNVLAYVQNNPVTGIDPSGLVNWRRVGVGFAEAVGGGVGIGAAATTEVTTVGAGTVAAVTLVSFSVPALGHGVSEMVAGFLESDSNRVPDIPPVSAPALVGFAATGDMNTAKNLDFAGNVLSLGLNARSITTGGANIYNTVGSITDSIQVGNTICSYCHTGK